MYFLKMVFRQSEKLFDFNFDLANFKGEVITTLRDSNWMEKPFTIQAYFEIGFSYILHASPVKTLMMKCS